MKLGIVAPCYNEHEVLAESAGRLTVLMDDLVAKKKIDADSFIHFSFVRSESLCLWGEPGWKCRPSACYNGGNDDGKRHV